MPSGFFIWSFLSIRCSSIPAKVSTASENDLNLALSPELTFTLQGVVLNQWHMHALIICLLAFFCLNIDWCFQLRRAR